MRIKDANASSVIEYIVMILLVVGGMAVMQPFIARALNGTWKKSGETFGYGRQYQAGKTAECAYSQISADYGVWYDNNCYQQAAAATCVTGDQVCENTQKINCSYPSNPFVSYCCENNTAPNTNCN